MNWYQKSKNHTSPKMVKNSSSQKKMEKQAAEIDIEHDFISKETWNDLIYISSNRTHETTYNVQLVCRQIDNTMREPYWLTMITAFSFEAGNIVYKKLIYHKEKDKAKKAYDQCREILRRLQQEQEANNLPTATLPSMIWYALHDIDGDPDLKPKARNNIVYLRQNHNLDENKGNLFKNIIFLDHAQKRILENDPNVFVHQQEGMF